MCGETGRTSPSIPKSDIPIATTLYALWFFCSLARESQTLRIHSDIEHSAAIHFSPDTSSTRCEIAAKALSSRDLPHDSPGSVTSALPAPPSAAARVGVKRHPTHYRSGFIAASGIREISTAARLWVGKKGVDRCRGRKSSAAFGKVGPFAIKPSAS